jgi:hypothetical protein
LKLDRGLSGVEPTYLMSQEMVALVQGDLFGNMARQDWFVSHRFPLGRTHFRLDQIRRHESMLQEIQPLYVNKVRALLCPVR